MSILNFLHSGGNKVSLTTPASNPASDLTFKLPQADGSSGQALVTNGSGALSFASMPSSGPVLQYKFEGNNTSRTHNTQSWSDSGFGSVTITPTNATTINIISFTTKATVGSGGQTYYSIYFSTNGGSSYAQVPGLDSNISLHLAWCL